MKTETTEQPSGSDKVQALVRYSFNEFKNGEVRIDFRNFTGSELRALRNLCERLQPTRKVPAYEFGACYYCKDGEWFEGGAHQLKGETCRACEIELPNATNEPELAEHAIGSQFDG